MKINNVAVASPERFSMYAHWLARALAARHELAKYPCPHCEASLYTAIPSVGDVADTVASCPLCGDLFLKVVDNTTGEPVVGVQVPRSERTGQRLL